MLHAFARRSGLSEDEARDAVQESLIAVFTTFREMATPFDRSKGSFKAWLRGIARHKVQTLLRQRARRESPGAPAALGGLRSAAADEPDVVFETEWRRSLLARALERVARESDPAVFQAFELYALHDEPPQRVAELLGISRNAVYISKTRVLQRLRRVLDELLAAEE